MLKRGMLGICGILGGVEIVGYCTIPMYNDYIYLLSLHFLLRTEQTL